MNIANVFLTERGLLASNMKTVGILSLISILNLNNTFFKAQYIVVLKVPLSALTNLPTAITLHGAWVADTYSPIG